MLETVAEWCRTEPLETSYPLKVFFDAIRVKDPRRRPGPQQGCLSRGLASPADGTKEIVCLWIETTEGAKLFLKVMNDLKARCVEDILIAVVDSLRGFPEAIEAVSSAGHGGFQNLHRPSHPQFAGFRVSWKRPEARRRRSYGKSTRRRRRRGRPQGPAGGVPLEDVALGSRKYAAIGQIWRRQWEQIVIPFFAFAPAVRKIVYTTNAIEALNAKLRRAVRARGHFPSDEAAAKLIFLVLRQVARQWKMPPREWAEAKTQFAIMFGDRFVRT